MQAVNEKERYSYQNSTSNKTKESEDGSFPEKIARRKGSRRKQVCWQQVWGRDWVKSAENKADDVGEVRLCG